MNNQLNHIMIRITALDSRPSAAIAAIAAVAFNPETGTIADQMVCNVDICSSQREGGTIDASWVKSLARQSSESRAALVSDDARELHEALSLLNRFVLRQGQFGHCPVWFKDLDSDAPVIYSAMTAAEISPVWQFTHSHHIRTLLEFVPQNDLAGPFAHPGRTSHELLDDALHQAQMIIWAWRRMASMSGSWRGSISVTTRCEMREFR